MNTAPKLSTRDKLKELLSSAYHHGRNSFHFNTGDQADKFLAPLAPPSGEGMGLTVADAWFESPTEITIHAKASRGAKLPEEGTKIYTTPQSAPVDGDLSRIGELIRTQDNRITDQPMFIVQQKREYVAHPDYGHDLIAWFDGDGEANEEEAAALEAQYKDTHREPAGWTRAPVGYYWEFVTACFTEQGCKDYISSNGHNLREPRIYAEGSYRNAEWRAVRNYLAELTTPPPPASQERGGERERVLELFLGRIFAAQRRDIDGNYLGWKISGHGSLNAVVSEAREYLDCPLSPPSSAAAAKEPEQRCPYCAGLIYSDAGCQNCKVGSVWPKPIAAEQAKPTFPKIEDRSHEIFIADGMDGDPPVAEQAQAGEDEQK